MSQIYRCLANETRRPPRSSTRISCGRHAIDDGDSSLWLHTMGLLSSMSHRESAIRRYARHPSGPTFATPGWMAKLSGRPAIMGPGIAFLATNSMHRISKWIGISPGWLEVAVIALVGAVVVLLAVALITSDDGLGAAPPPPLPDMWKRGSPYWINSKRAEGMPIFVRLAQGLREEHRESDFHD